MIQKLPTYAEAQKAICGAKDPKAFLHLGILYAQGIGTEQNDMLADYFIKKAIDMGCKKKQRSISSLNMSLERKSLLRKSCQHSRKSD